MSRASGVESDHPVRIKTEAEAEKFAGRGLYW
jgi:hypothetical protein